MLTCRRGSVKGSVARCGRDAFIWITIFVCGSPMVRGQGLKSSWYSGSGVKDLTADADFRSVKLRWQYLGVPEPPGFTIQLCELSSQGAKYRCRERHLLVDMSEGGFGHDYLTSSKTGHYEAVIHDLRMLTNYSASVEPILPNNVPSTKMRDRQRAKLYGINKSLVTTKGFSARASRCLANSSDITVRTGPYFGGKVAVEDTTDPRCAVYGNRSSSQETYTLRIVHRLCGSRITNGSTVETTVVVHESRGIVTHNSRRFLVQCNFMPEIYTIRAAFHVPIDDSRDSTNHNFDDTIHHVDENDIFSYDAYRQNHVRDSRIQEEHRPAVDRTSASYESQMLGQMVLLIILIIIVTIGCGFALWCYVTSSRKRSKSIIKPVTQPEAFLTLTTDKDMLMKESSIQKDVPNNVLQLYGAPVALVSMRSITEL